MHSKILGFLAYFLIGFGVFVFIIALSLAFCFSANAQDSGWLPRRWHGQKKPYVYRQSQNQRYHDPRERGSPRYYKAIEESPSRQARCFGRLFTDKGREFSSEEAALKDAERSWGALVREEPGERWMDLKFAERYESRCQRSSTGESATAKITETLTGGSLGLLYRCRIWAEPCLAPKTSDGKTSQ